MSRRGGAGEGVLLGLLLSVPVVAIPLFQIPMMFWARWSFYQRHPDYVQHSAPTISRAISDPAIGGPFAMMILAVTAVVLLALVPIFHGYRTAIDTRFAQLARAQDRLLRKEPAHDLTLCGLGRRLHVTNPCTRHAPIRGFVTSHGEGSPKIGNA